jgi:hypothetical protein
MENDGKSRGHHGTKRKKGDVFPQQILFFPSPISEVFLAASPHNRVCLEICLNIVMFIGKMMINPIDFFCATDATAFDKEIPPGQLATHRQTAACRQEGGRDQAAAPGRARHHEVRTVNH